MEKKVYVPQVKEMDSVVFWSTFGNHSRIELKNSAFAIGKLNIGLQKFDDNNKQVAYINAYLDLSKALLLAKDIEMGRFVDIARKNANNGDMVVVYKHQGGQPAEKANREDGKPLYREFTISKGKLWIISCQEGPGQVSATGGFLPDGKPDNKVSVGLSTDSLREMAEVIKAEYYAYRTAQYSNLTVGGLLDKLFERVKGLFR